MSESKVVKAKFPAFLEECRSALTDSIAGMRKAGDTIDLDFSGWSDLEVLCILEYVDAMIPHTPENAHIQAMFATGLLMAIYHELDTEESMNQYLASQAAKDVQDYHTKVARS